MMANYLVTLSGAKSGISHDALLRFELDPVPQKRKRTEKDARRILYERVDCPC